MREFGGTINEEGFDYFQWSLPWTDLIELIPHDARRILDVGCGIGKTGQLLRERGSEEIFEVEVDPRAAQQAKPFYKEVIVGEWIKISSRSPRDSSTVSVTTMCWNT